ncbi:MAG TPA: hypothetical protein VIY29_19815 [Ktedonobacteraceae bacterium]
MRKPDKMHIKKFGTSNYAQVLGKVLVLLLALSLAACSSSTLATSKPTPTPIPSAIFPTSGPVEQTAKPGSIEVKITLVEFRVISSVTVFHANTDYYFVVSNRGQDIHEFMIMPDKPDGSPLSPDEQYKGMLIEMEPILPGATWATNFTFRATGRFEIACQMGRHYLAGMRLPIAVTK